jgi:two-component system, NarL family, nitrate/nitrite response regulator NarL
MATVVSRIHDTYISRALRDCKSATLVIATRHDVVGAGVEALLHAAGHKVVACCSEEDDLLSSVQAHRPDITMLADNVVVQNAAATVSRLRTHGHSMAIIFLLEGLHSTTTKDLLALDVEAILLGAAPAASFTDCVQSVCQGGKWVDIDLLRHLVTVERSPPIANSLTSRESNVACLVSHGLSNKEIARALNLCEGTVKMHLHHIYEKLHLSGRTQLALSVREARAPMPVASHDEHRAAGDDSNSTAAPRRANGHNLRTGSA